MKKAIASYLAIILAAALLLTVSLTSFGQGMFPNGWRHNEGNPINSPNLNIQGYGINAAGADIGDPVITVTNTNTSGAGSLNNAIFNAIGGTGSATSHKKIVFNISGGVGPHIIASDFTITSLSFVTIDGTGQIIVIDSPNSCAGAPCNDGMSFENTGAHHIIVKNMHFRDCQDGLNVVDGAHDIAIMNCALWLNHDGNIDIASDSHNVTIQYCVIGPHINECHCGSGGAGGTLVTGFDNSVHHNLYNPGASGNPDEGERLPFIHGNYSNAFADVRNNIVYNYGRNNATGSGYGSGLGYDVDHGTSDNNFYGRANFVNNYYYTPSTAADQDGISLSVDGRLASGYSAGNVSGNGFNFNAGAYTNHAEWTVSSPFNIDVETACQAVSNVLAHAGPDTKHADITAIIASVTNLGTCGIMNLPPPLLINRVYERIAHNKYELSCPICILENESVGLAGKRYRLTKSLNRNV